MKRIGVDLEKLVKGEPFPTDHVPDCPGASVRITRKDFDDMVKGGEFFVTARKDIPDDGYGTARLQCHQSVQRLVRTETNAVQFYGLCFSCTGVEERNRTALRQRQSPGKVDDRQRRRRDDEAAE